ncbi:MAG: hypothetical protein HY075_13570 [Deltaproteobacteria bacterium]|nr:hypothetical protein [Deltaproteobacteria bacterium]
MPGIILLLLLPHWPAIAGEGFVGALASGYRWGTYSSAGESEDTHSGIGLHASGGYRFFSNVDVGARLAFGFPQITVPESSSSAAFDYRAFGLQAGYLWRGKVEPYVHYSPYAHLAQSTKARSGVGTVTTELAYTGAAYGAGLKVFLTDDRADVASVQVGLDFSYTRESYSRATVSTSISSDTQHAPPPFTPSSESHKGKQTLGGDTYLLGLFIGI